MRLTLLLCDHLVVKEFDLFDTDTIRWYVSSLFCSFFFLVVALLSFIEFVEPSFLYSLIVFIDRLFCCCCYVHVYWALYLQLFYCQEFGSNSITMRQRNWKNSVYNCHRSAIPFWLVNFVWSPNTQTNYQQAMSCGI